MTRHFTILATGVILAGVMAGCSASSSTDCKAEGNNVTICVNKKPIDFSAAKNKPHSHETGSIYAPGKVLADALGVPFDAQVAADGKSAKVTVNGKPFEPAMAATTDKGIHVHDGDAFVPVREFAAAAGLKVDVKADQGTAGFAK